MDEVHLRTALHDFLGDIVLKGRAAEDDRDFGMALLECARQRDARERLLKHDGETDQTEASPVDTVETEVNECRREPLADVAQIGYRTTRLLVDRPQIAAIDFEI